MTENTTADSTVRRVVIVTGGSGGIGRQGAERLAADGLAVVINYAGEQGGCRRHGRSHHLLLALHAAA